MSLISIIIAINTLFYSNADARKMIQIKGSDTLINLIQRISEEYMERYPATYIAVTGGGSGTGIAALINGKCDIANSSRIMEPRELKQAKDRGMDIKRIVIAMDGLSVITNQNNPINKLTIDQLGKIFRGEITNWKELGGKNMRITLYGRQSNSGTFIFFREAILKGDYSQNMNRMNGNAQIVEAVKQDVSGIGYVGVGYVKDVKGIKVLKIAKDVNSEYISPLDCESVEEGKYPIARPLNQYINGMPTGDVKKFIEFELGDRGQEIVKEEGFFPVAVKYQNLNHQLGL